MNQESDRPARLTHLDDEGRARMVDVGEKPVTVREAVAVARLHADAAAIEAIGSGALPKGDALQVARLAGIQAAKRTAEWIPLCHQLPLDSVAIDLEVDPERGCVMIRATARAQARTGVEMEALVGAGAAALALYDMVKAVDRAMVIEEVRLESKRGGRRGDFVHPRSTGGEA
jgi:cyclic pyranopterin phosphate synthase